MDDNERRVIDDLFGRIRQLEAGSGQRDAEAEALIRRHLGDQPAAPYYMAQAIVVQEQALAASQQRVDELERQLAARQQQGSFLGGMFGRPAASPATAAAATLPQGRSSLPAMPVGASAPTVGPWARAAAPDPAAAMTGQRTGGSFMAGAMQTAMGVAGGMLIGNALSHVFESTPAQASEHHGDVAAHQHPDAPHQGHHFPDDGGMGDSGGFDDEL